MSSGLSHGTPTVFSPSYFCDSTTAIVDGALSVTAYLDALTGAWTDLAAQGGPAMAEIDRVLYHQPFTKMAKKAQVHLAGLTGEDLDTEIVAGTPGGSASTRPRDTGLATSTLYNRRLGNSYTASLYAGLCSLLDVLVGQPMDRVIEDLPLAGAIRDALLGVENPPRALLRAVTSYERGEWRAAEQFAADVGLDAGALPAAHAAALTWARKVQGGANQAAKAATRH